MKRLIPLLLTATALLYLAFAITYSHAIQAAKILEPIAHLSLFATSLLIVMRLRKDG